MNVIRLTGLYALTCVIGIAANIALLGFPQLLWIAAPILMLVGMILSVPFSDRSSARCEPATSRFRKERRR